MNKNIKFEGKTVGIRYMDAASFVKARRRIGEVDYCPLCVKLFEESCTGKVVLLISNQIGLPNRFCHAECYEASADPIRVISETYKSFLKESNELKTRYPDWVEYYDSYGWTMPAPIKMVEEESDD